MRLSAFVNNPSIFLLVAGKTRRVWVLRTDNDVLFCVQLCDKGACSEMDADGLRRVHRAESYYYPLSVSKNHDGHTACTNQFALNSFSSTLRMTPSHNFSIYYHLHPHSYSLSNISSLALHSFLFSAPAVLCESSSASFKYEVMVTHLFYLPLRSFAFHRLFYQFAVIRSHSSLILINMASSYLLPSRFFALFHSASCLPNTFNISFRGTEHCMLTTHPKDTLNLCETR